MKKAQCVERGSVRIIVPVVISFFLGVAVTALWSHRPAGHGGENPVSPPPVDEHVGLPAPAPAPAPVESHPEPIDPAVIDEVKQEVPDYSSISLEDGEQILRTAALKDFAAAAKETDEQINAAQQQLQDAQNTKSAAEQQAAMKRVQETQMAAAEKLKGIAARLETQIAALKSLKNGQ